MDMFDTLKNLSLFFQNQLQKFFRRLDRCPALDVFPIHLFLNSDDGFYVFQLAG